MKEKTKKWFVWSGIALVFLLIGMYIVPMISFAVNPNASSQVIRETVTMIGEPINSYQGAQWLSTCNNNCVNEFGHNAQQLSVCTEKCSNYLVEVLGN